MNDFTQLTDQQRHWLAHIEAAQQSSLSLAAYARNQGLAPQTLYQWRHLFRQQGRLPASPRKVANFAQVQVMATMTGAADAPIRLELGGRPVACLPALAGLSLAGALGTFAGSGFTHMMRPQGGMPVYLHHEPVDFRLPEEPAGPWWVRIDTGRAAGRPDGPRTLRSGATVSVPDRSLLLLELPAAERAAAFRT